MNMFFLGTQSIYNGEYKAAVSGRLPLSCPSKRKEHNGTQGRWLSIESFHATKRYEERAAQNACFSFL